MIIYFYRGIFAAVASYIEERGGLKLFTLGTYLETIYIFFSNRRLLFSLSDFRN